MNTYKYWQKALLQSIQLQLFISFISLPFLIAWGLPVSLLSPISTLIFGPFLTCFLCISSMMFFLELLYLPNSFLVWMLEKVTHVWITCLNLEQQAWLIGFCKPSCIVLFCIPLVALLIIHYKKINSIVKRILLLGLFLIIICLALKIFPAKSLSEKIPCHKGEISLIYKNNSLILVDSGYISASPSYESYIAYTLLPAIIEKTGKQEIDHLIMGKINKRILDALSFLATKITIKNIYLPYWNGKAPFCMWKSYIYLKNIMKLGNGKIISVSYKKDVYINQNKAFTIHPSSKEIKYHELTYHPLSVTENK